MNEVPETIRAQLVKIRALAESGVEGERQNAARMLDALCLKHGVSMESLVSNERASHRFTYRSADELRVLWQCAFYITQTSRLAYSKRGRSISLRLTKAEAIDLRACFAHYRAAWRKQVEELSTAFFCRHKLFGPRDEAQEAEPRFSQAELERLLALMRGISGQTWLRPLARLSA